MKNDTLSPQRVIGPLLAVYLFIYVWSVPMLMFGLVPDWGTWMGGFLLILQGSICALWLGANAGMGGWLAALLIGGLSWGVEHLGVTTGWPFGHYSYTEVLGIKLLGAVPLPIPFAWLLVVPGALSVAALLRADRRFMAVVAPLLALGLDLLLEPVAAYVVDYWRWRDGGPFYGVPTANFVAWGATALLLCGLTLALTGRRLVRPTVLPSVPALLYVLNLAQFALVDLAHGFWLAALIGAGLLGLLWWRLRPDLAAWWREGWLSLAALRRVLRPD